MKKLKLFDNSILETEIGWDNVLNKWSMSSNVKEMELEDGSIVVNPDFVEPEL